MRTIFAIAVVFALLLTGCPGGDDVSKQDPIDPTVTWPAGLTAVSGQTLGDIALNAYDNDGGTPGAFSWTTPAASVGHGYGASTYSMTFTPTDRSAYHTVSDDVDVAVTIAMVLVEKGTFEMGKNGDGTANNDPYGGIRTVTLTQDFYIGKYEVTQAQYKAVMETTIEEQQALWNGTNITNYGRGDNYPMYFVSWFDAIVFCNKLSMMEGFTPAFSIDGETDPAEWGEVPATATHDNYAKYQDVEIVADSTGYRLPSEAQWEYAAKGGHKASDPYYIYSGSNRIGRVAWYYNNNGTAGTEFYGAKRVGTKQANELGIHDMSGNIVEWCLDNPYNQYDPPGTTDDPLTWVTGSYNSNKNNRGGHWADSFQTRLVYGSGMYPYSRGFYYGIRLVRPAE